MFNKRFMQGLRPARRHAFHDDPLLPVELQDENQYRRNHDYNHPELDSFLPNFRYSLTLLQHRFRVIDLGNNDGLSSYLHYFDHDQNGDGNSSIQSIYRTKLEQSIWENNWMSSSIWSPISHSFCSRTTPSQYAPCIAKRLENENSDSDLRLTTRIYGEELIYPDFALPLPIFPRLEDREKWLSAVEGIKERGVVRKDEDYLVYKSQHGQNFVMHDIDFTPPANFDTWAAETCMSPSTRLSGLSISARNHTTPISAEDQQRYSRSTPSLLVNSPDAWSFQHFLDRVTHIVSQASHLYKSEDKTIALTGRRGSGLVPELWSKLGFQESRNELKHNPNSREVMSLDKLIFSCKTPLIHPYLSWKSAEMLGLPWTKGGADEEFDTTSKNIVLYMSRSNGRAMNGGRKVLNEVQLLRSIGEYLDSKGRGEKLQLFEEIQYPTLEKLIEFMSDRVLAIIGPHGGGLMNHRFMSPQKSLVLEFFPSNRIEFLNFEEASILNQTYSTIIVDPAEGTRDDMIIDFQDVKAVLEGYLGKNREEKIQLSYGWKPE